MPVAYGSRGLDRAIPQFPESLLACQTSTRQKGLENQIWWAWPSWLRRQIVALKIVGSNPIVHPIKITPSIGWCYFFWNSRRWDSKDQSHTPVGCALPLAGQRQHLTFAIAKGNESHRPPQKSNTIHRMVLFLWNLESDGIRKINRTPLRGVHCRWLDSGNTLTVNCQLSIVNSAKPLPPRKQANSFAGSPEWRRCSAASAADTGWYRGRRRCRSSGHRR